MRRRSIDHHDAVIIVMMRIRVKMASRSSQQGELVMLLFVMVMRRFMTRKST
jgi:hypothetical protein